MGHGQDRSSLGDGGLAGVKEEVGVYEDMGAELPLSSFFWNSTNFVRFFMSGGVSGGLWRIHSLRHSGDMKLEADSARHLPTESPTREQNLLYGNIIWSYNVSKSLADKEHALTDIILPMISGASTSGAPKMASSLSIIAARGMSSDGRW